MHVYTLHQKDEKGTAGVRVTTVWLLVSDMSTL